MIQFKDGFKVLEALERLHLQGFRDSNPGSLCFNFQNKSATVAIEGTSSNIKLQNHRKTIIYARKCNLPINMDVTNHEENRIEHIMDYSRVYFYPSISWILYPKSS